MFFAQNGLLRFFVFCFATKGGCFRGNAEEMIGRISDVSQTMV
jgi:hypothetical protein